MADSVPRPRLAPPASYTPASGGDRQVPDHAAGRTWYVRELADPTRPAGDGACTLAAFTHDAVRRIWEAPPDWRGLDDAALLALINAPAAARR